jgi:hypothetical protein
MLLVQSGRGLGVQVQHFSCLEQTPHYQNRNRNNPVCSWIYIILGTSKTSKPFKVAKAYAQLRGKKFKILAFQ